MCSRRQSRPGANLDDSLVEQMCDVTQHGLDAVTSRRVDLIADLREA